MTAALAETLPAPAPEYVPIPPTIPGPAYITPHGTVNTTLPVWAEHVEDAAVMFAFWFAQCAECPCDETRRALNLATIEVNTVLGADGDGIDYEDLYAAAWRAGIVLGRTIGPVES